MKKLLDSPYLWLVTAFLCALFLPLLIIVSYGVIYEILFNTTLPIPKVVSYSFLDALEQTDPVVNEVTMIGRFILPTGVLICCSYIHIPTGFILGGCFGRALYLWRRQEARSVRAAKKFVICGSLLVLLGFGYFTWKIWSQGGIGDRWFTSPFVGYPLFFALVLFLWGLHLPNARPQLQKEAETLS